MLGELSCQDFAMDMENQLRQILDPFDKRCSGHLSSWPMFRRAQRYGGISGILGRSDELQNLSLYHPARWLVAQSPESTVRIILLERNKIRQKAKPVSRDKFQRTLPSPLVARYSKEGPVAIKRRSYRSISKRHIQPAIGEILSNFNPEARSFG
jgi:hypothetical protein